MIHNYISCYLSSRFQLFLTVHGTNINFIIRNFVCQFEESGLIDRVRAIAFGEFHHCGPDEGARYEWTVKEVLQAYARKWGKPAVMGLPFGHGADNAWLPLGQMAGLEARLDGVRFTLL